MLQPTRFARVLGASRATARKWTGVPVATTRVTRNVGSSRPVAHAAIASRRLPRTFERGVRRLRSLRPSLPVRARSTLHEKNFRALPGLIEKAASMGLSQVSFPADATYDSFGRRAPGASLTPDGLLLDVREAKQFAAIIDEALVAHAAAFEGGRVAERGDKLRRLATYYSAHNGDGAFPAVQCNAPWVSAVVESDGTVRPCFFQPAVGSLRESSLSALLTHEMVDYRRGLDVGRDGTCQKCVCSLSVGLRTRIG